LRYALTNNRNVNDAFHTDNLFDRSARGSAFHSDNGLNGTLTSTLSSALACVRSKAKDFPPGESAVVSTPFIRSSGSSPVTATDHKLAFSLL